MSKIGYYRYKCLADIEKIIPFYINSELVCEHTIKPILVCGTPKVLKYLDSNGQYRIYPFSSVYRSLETQKQIGSVNKFITSILTGQTNKQNIGYNNERKLELTANVAGDELEKLTDIYTSPRVYLFIGTGNSDLANDWLEVTIEIKDAIIHRPKGNYGQMDITVNLPEQFTIKNI